MLVYWAMDSGKPADAPKTVNLKLSPAAARRVAAAAAKRGQTKRAFLADAADLAAGFDADAWQLVTSWADLLQLPPAVVLRAFVLARLAVIEAEAEALGDPGRVELPEFRMTADGPLAARHLLAILKAEHLEELQRAAAVIAAPCDGPKAAAAQGR